MKEMSEEWETKKERKESIKRRKAFSVHKEETKGRWNVKDKWMNVESRWWKKERKFIKK